MKILTETDLDHYINDFYNDKNKNTQVINLYRTLIEKNKKVDELLEVLTEQKKQSEKTLTELTATHSSFIQKMEEMDKAIEENKKFSMLVQSTQNLTESLDRNQRALEKEQNVNFSEVNNKLYTVETELKKSSEQLNKLYLDIVNEVKTGFAQIASNALFSFNTFFKKYKK